MAMKMDRRSFLKTSAAVAVAVSMTGLLGGCSDGAIGTKFGRFQAAVGLLREKDNAMVGGVAAEWKGEVLVWVRIKDCSDDKRPDPVYAASHFYLNINGTSIESYAVGDLLEKGGKITLTKGQFKEGWMHFALNADQKDLYDAIAAKTAKVIFVIEGGTERETYELDYNTPEGYAFVKQTV